MRMELAMSSIHSPLLSDSLSEFLRPVPVKRRPIRAFFTRLAHAWRLARNRLTEEDARALYLQCQNKLGWYTLDLLTTSDAIEAAREVFNDNPELPRLITEACAAVGQRWNATENTAKARERVFELAESLSKTEDQLLAFPLSRRSEASQQIEPSPIHMHYAPRRLAQIPHYSKSTGIGAATPITEFDHAAARRDGWVLADLGTYPDGKPRIEIQAYIPPRYIGKRTFTCDRNAWDHVVKEARAGSALHLQALDLIDPRERMVIEASTEAWSSQ
jgi:hypothetical protein